jgi:hypothetical protein
MTFFLLLISRTGSSPVQAAAGGSPHPLARENNYSVLRLFIGFAIAALMAWKLTVINAIPNIRPVARENIQTLILIR